MQHLDEGTLQAWLDRPRSGLDPSEIAEIERHLGSCGLCGARVKALRESSIQTRSLLATGRERIAPAPPFEQIAARAEGSRNRRRAQKRLTKMAWAASIVVALGVGWLTNDLYRAGPGAGLSRYDAPPAVQERATAADATASAQAQSSEAAAEEAPTAPEDARPAVPVEAGSGAPAEPEVPAPVAARRNAPAAPASPARAAAPTRVSPSAVAQSKSLAVPEPLADVGVSQAAAGEPVVVSGLVVDERGNPVPAAQVFVSDRDVGVLTQLDGRYSLALPEPTDADSTSFDLTVQRIGYGQQTRELAGRGGDTVVADFDLKEEAVALDEIVVTGTPGGTQRRALGNSVSSLTVSPWRSATAASAAGALGESLRTVPGLGVLTIEVDDDGAAGGTPLVRIRQQLGDGLTLTLLEGRSDQDVEQWSLSGEGPIESIRVGDLLITGTAPVLRESLRAMLEAMR